MACPIMEAKVPRTAVFKLKTQMCWWYSSSLSLKGWELGKLSIVPGQRLAGLISRKSLYFISSLKGGKNNIPLLEGSHIREVPCYLWEGEPFVTFRPTDWVRPTHIGENDLLYSSDSNIDLIHKHLHRHTIKNIWPNGHLEAQSQWH